MLDMLRDCKTGSNFMIQSRTSSNDTVSFDDKFNNIIWRMQSYKPNDLKGTWKGFRIRNSLMRHQWKQKPRS